MAKNGLDASMGGDDTFAKGIVGKRSETDSIRTQEQVGLGETTLLYGGGLFKKESAGLEDGVSARMELNPDDSEPTYNYAVDPMTGNAPERKVGRADNETVTGKRGNKFSVGSV